MARRDYFSQAYPEPWRILGVPLLPLSLGHYLKLRRLECAFVADEPTSATMYDLLMGVAVCSMRSDPDATKDPFWNWFCGLERKPFYLRFRNTLVQCFGRQPMNSAEWDMLRWGRKCGPFDFESKVKLFSEYVRQHSAAPGFWEEPREGANQSGAHWSHAVLHTLTSKCGYSLDQAYNTPLSKALHDFYKEAENQGCGRIMSDEELRLTEAARDGV